MKYSNRLFFAFLLLCSLINVNAQPAKWAAQPYWDIVEPFGENLLRIQVNGRWGLVTYSGKSVIPCDNHIITDIHEDKFLVLNDRNQLLSIGNEDGTLTKPNGTWYVSKNYPYFSGNLLAVHDTKNKWGYLNTEGRNVIEADKNLAFPFCYSLAVVEYKNRDLFLMTNDEQFRLEGREFEDNISFASSFTQFGNDIIALVVANKKLYLVDRYGKKISKYDIPKKGVKLVDDGSESRIRGTDGIETFEIELNSIREIECIKSGGAIHRSDSKPTKMRSFPIVHEVNIIDGKISVGSTKLSKQFQQIIPLRSDLFLVKKDNKFGIIKIDGSQQIAQLSLKDNKQSNKDGNIITLTISGNASEKTSAYVLDSSNNPHVLSVNITDNTIKVDNKYVGADNTMRVGLVVDNIMFDPVPIQVKHKGIDPDKSNSSQTPNNGSNTGKDKKTGSRIQQKTKIVITKNGRELKENKITLKKNEIINVGISGTQDRVKLYINGHSTSDRTIRANMILAGTAPRYYRIQAKRNGVIIDERTITIEVEQKLNIEGSSTSKKKH